MARVPATIPAEPRETRCGDSYQQIVYVNGEIPGTEFGGQFEQKLEPIKLQGTSTYPSPVVPIFESEAAMREETEAPGGLRDRLTGIYSKLDLDNWAYTSQDMETLKELARRGLRLLRDANIEMRIDGHEDEARQDILDATRFLRCAEYWTWRILLYKQALEKYEPPVYPEFVVAEEEPDLGGIAPLPPLPDDEDDEVEVDDEKPAKKAEPKKISPVLIVGGLAIAGGLAYFLFFRKK